MLSKENPILSRSFIRPLEAALVADYLGFYNLSVFVYIYRQFVKMVASKREQILKLFQQSGVLRARDVTAAGIARTYLNQLLNEGVIDRASRGLYVLSNGNPTEQRSLVEAARRVPQGVICLLSALQFHKLTTQAPFEVWLAIDFKARIPKPGSPAMHVVRFSGKALTHGVQDHMLEGTRVRVFSPAKTVADCFKYRNKIGIDVAIEALRDCLRQRKATHDEIWQAAKICRMTNVMRSYLEAVV